MLEAENTCVKKKTLIRYFIGETIRIQEGVFEAENICVYNFDILRDFIG